MTEHVHEWGHLLVGFRSAPHIDKYICDCGADLGNKEVERRLNATERLSALQAKELIVFAMGSTRVSQPELADALQAYADILEGKDE